MKDENICPKWRFVTGNLGTCEDDRDWVCERSYAKDNYHNCPIFKSANVEKDRHGENNKT